MIIVIIIALLLSAFFSGSEIAYVSANKLGIEVQKKHNTLFALGKNIIPHISLYHISIPQKNMIPFKKRCDYCMQSGIVPLTRV